MIETYSGIVEMSLCSKDLSIHTGDPTEVSRIVETVVLEEPIASIFPVSSAQRQS